MPERDFKDLNDVAEKRKNWPADLGLEDSIYQTIHSSQEQELAIEIIYEDKPILERRAIEVKAKYLKAMLTPAEIAWATFEKQYEVYPRPAFIMHTHWANRRSEWIKLLGLDYKPFSYIRVGATETDVQTLEAAWSVKSAAERQTVEEKARLVKETANPLLLFWYEVESVFGYSEDKEKYFKKDPAAYTKKRELWLGAVGMSSRHTRTSH